jgi:hypothetical protein
MLANGTHGGESRFRRDKHEVPYGANCGIAQQNAAGDLTEAGENADALLLFKIAYGVLQDDMRNFVRHHTGELHFRISDLNGSQIHEDCSAGKRKDVDVVHVDHVKVVGPAITGACATSSCPSVCTYLTIGSESGRTGICL